MRRLFVAITLPPALRPAVAALRPELPEARWVRPEQLHLTLRFLGSTPDDRVDQVRTRLRAVRVPPFTIALAGLGTFPRRGKPPRVLWAGLQPATPVQALKAAIDAQLGPDPQEAERGFSPHLTIARLPDRRLPGLRPLLQAHAGFTGEPFQVAEFHLYDSSLRPEGAVHTLLEAYPL